METFFYVAGAALVLLALVISALGLRSDRFPSAGILRVGVLIVLLLVGATSYAAVQLSEDEQELRLAEENEAADELAAEEEAAAESEGAVEAPAPAEQGQGPAGGGSELAATGEGVFLAQGCGGCHSLAALGGQAVGDVGPNLDEALVEQDADYIRTSIVDPSAEIAEGFGDGIMPGNFEAEIPAPDLDALVAFLDEAAGAEVPAGPGE